MEDLAAQELTATERQRSKFENEVLVKKKKRKTTGVLFLGLKMEKLTNSVSDKKSLLAKLWKWQDGEQISEGRICTQDLTEDLLRSTRVPENVLYRRNTGAHTQKFTSAWISGCHWDVGRQENPSLRVKNVVFPQRIASPSIYSADSSVLPSLMALNLSGTAVEEAAGGGRVARLK